MYFRSTLAILTLLLTNDLCAQPKVDRQLSREDLNILKTTLEELHPDLYRYTSRTEFEARADSIRTSLQDDLDPIQFYLRIAPLVTQIKNGHTAIRLPQLLCDTMKVLPLRLIAFDRKVYVNKDLSGSDRALVGKQILNINGVPVDEIVQKSLAYVSVDGLNDYARFKAVVEDDLALFYALIYGGRKNFQVAFADQHSDQQSTMDMRAITCREFLARYDQGESFPWRLKRVDSLTAVLTLRSFGNVAYSDGKKKYFHQTIPQFFELIKAWRTERLILDIRFNGGGELKNSILLYAYLAGGPFQFTKRLEMASIIPPTHSAYTNYKKAVKFGPIHRKHVRQRSDKVFEVSGHFSQEIVKPKEEAFKGRLLVLVNGNTASAAGALASCIRNDKRGLIIGEENRDNYTGFSAGVPVVLTLPHSGISVSIPIRKFTYATGQDTGRGIVPDYAFASTANDFFTNQNECLNFAIGFLSK